MGFLLLQDIEDKLLAFDSACAAIDAMKGPVSASQLFAADQRGQKTSTGAGLSEKEIGKLWKDKGNEESSMWELKAVYANKGRLYKNGLGSNESDESRMAYRMLLTCFALKRSSGRNAAVARALRLSRNATDKKGGAWRDAIDKREAIDGGKDSSWMPNKRKIGNMLPMLTRSLVDSFWNENCPEDPCEKNEMRMRIARKKWVSHRLQHQMMPIRDMHTKYNKEHPHAAVSFTAFYLRKPWYVRRVKQNTCLCSKCENVRLVRKCGVEYRHVTRATLLCFSSIC
jgi:hypothetical protein